MVYSDVDEELIDGSWYFRYGIKFKWTNEHRTPKQLEPLIRSYDTVATDAVGRLEEIASSPPHAISAKGEALGRDIESENETKSQRDLYSLIQQYASKDEKIGRLWTELNTVPEWVDWEQIERGQRIFFRYGGPAIIALTFLSLLGGMGSARTVETLVRTGGFDVKVVRRRLLETAQHTLNIHRDLKSIQPGGDGFADSVRVRLLHSTVRRRIMQMASQRPEYYDMAKFGVPVNDLDSMGTINIFSATVIWSGLPRQGIYLRQQEILDYLALWRYIAYIMGAPHDWLATPQSAKRMMESLAISEIRPSAASADLANNIITGLMGQAPSYSSREFMCAQTYWLNGDELSRQLDIERPGLYYFFLVLGQCFFFMAISYINRSIGFLDRRNINVARKALYAVFLEDKSKGALGYTTKFPLKHIPEFDKSPTGRGDAASGSGIRKPGAERTALISLIVFPSLIGFGAWYIHGMVVQALG